MSTMRVVSSKDVRNIDSQEVRSGSSNSFLPYKCLRLSRSLGEKE